MGRLAANCLCLLCHDYVVIIKKILFLEDPAPWKWLDGRTDPADSGDRTALWWGDSETCGRHSHPQKKESSNANLNLGQHIANRVVVPLEPKGWHQHGVDLRREMDQKISAWFIHLLGKEKWKAATAKNPSHCRWRRKRDVLSCKLVRYCNTNLVLIWTRNLEAPELKAETSTYRPRFWDLGACLVWGTHWNYQLWKMDALTGNVFPSLRRHSVNLLFIKVWCK